MNINSVIAIDYIERDDRTIKIEKDSSEYFIYSESRIFNIEKQSNVLHCNSRQVG